MIPSIRKGNILPATLVPEDPEAASAPIPMTNSQLWVNIHHDNFAHTEEAKCNMLLEVTLLALASTVRAYCLGFQQLFCYEAL